MRPFATVVIFCLLTLTGFSQTDSNAGWSGDLLNRLLSAPAPEQPVHGDNDEGGEGMVLRSYQLRVLHLGDPGRAAHLVSILKRMLPPDSRVTEDAGANTLHIMTTGKAQLAALEFIAAMDVEVPGNTPSQTVPAVIPEDVRKALSDLAATRPDSVQLLKAVSDASKESERRIQDALAKSQEQTSENTRHLLFVGGAVVLGMIILVVVLMTALLRRAQKKDLAASKRNSVALIPTKSMEAILSQSSQLMQERDGQIKTMMESFTIAYQADRQRSQMTLEAITNKSAELTTTLERMEQLRREMGANGEPYLEANRGAIEALVRQASDVITSRAAEIGAVAESASKKMEETADRLEVQNEKAEKLAAELERTQKEVDKLYNKLRETQVEAEKAQAEANEQREIATRRAEELAKREAALAGLSILLQESPDEILASVNGAIESPKETKPKDDNLRNGSVSEPPLNGVHHEPLANDRANQSTDKPACENKKYTFRILPILPVE